MNKCSNKGIHNRYLSFHIDLTLSLYEHNVRVRRAISFFLTIKSVIMGLQALHFGTQIILLVYLGRGVLR